MDIASAQHRLTYEIASVVPQKQEPSSGDEVVSMHHRYQRSTAAIRLPIAAVALVSGSLALAGPQTPGTKGEIERALHEIMVGVQHGDSAATMSRKLYAKDVLIIGEGEAHTTQGISDAAKDTQAFWDSLGPGGNKGCRFQMVDPSVHSRDTFTSFLLLNCKANPPTLAAPITVRLLYSWKKLPEGWRVVLETWGTGTIDKSSGITDVTQ